MCELLAMSVSRPVEIGTYLARLTPRGGKTGPHADGWGVAYYEGRAARIFKDAAPAAESRCLSMLVEHHHASTSVIVHIRRAIPSNFGRTAANTHPFEREWRGRSWVFAHNGKLPGLHQRQLGADPRFRPIGETDSELTFCMILDTIAQGMGHDAPYRPTALVRTIEPLVDVLRTFGEFNFMLGDGKCLYVHAQTNLHLLEPAPAGDSDAAEKTILLATAPLTAEPWKPLKSDKILVYKNGKNIPLNRSSTAFLHPQAREPGQAHAAC